MITLGEIGCTPWLKRVESYVKVHLEGGE